MGVKIKDIRTICTAPEGINLITVKVETDQPGLYGLGCATFAYRHLTVQHLIENYLKPLLVGRDAENISELWQLMHQNGYWRNGPIENNAISGIDMALWDIKGKLAGMPLYQLFGGKVREGIPVYRHVDGKDIEEICENIQRFQEMGITHLRCQCGGYGGETYGCTPKSAPMGAHPGVYLDSRKYMRDTVKLFEQIRNRIGYDMELVHDVHERIAPIEAVKLAKELEAFDLFFLEDPVPLEQIEWLKVLREQTSIPIAQGELFNNACEWKTLITERYIDYIRVHLSQIGGITPARKLQIFAEQFGVRTAWHGPGMLSGPAPASLKSAASVFSDHLYRRWKNWYCSRDDL
jgi:mannonate dehydratase